MCKIIILVVACMILFFLFLQLGLSQIYVAENHLLKVNVHLASMMNYLRCRAGSSEVKLAPYQYMIEELQSITCPGMDHTTRPGSESQILASGYGTPSDQLSGWYSEIYHYGIPDAITGHAEALVDPSYKYVACGYKNCPHKQWNTVICTYYGEGGNGIMPHPQVSQTPIQVPVYDNFSPIDITNENMNQLRGILSEPEGFNRYARRRLRPTFGKDNKNGIFKHENGVTITNEYQPVIALHEMVKRRRKILRNLESIRSLRGRYMPELSNHQSAFDKQGDERLPFNRNVSTTGNLNARLGALNQFNLKNSITLVPPGATPTPLSAFRNRGTDPGAQNPNWRGIKVLRDGAANFPNRRSSGCELGGVDRGCNRFSHDQCKDWSAFHPAPGHIGDDTPFDNPVPFDILSQELGIEVDANLRVNYKRFKSGNRQTAQPRNNFPKQPEARGNRPANVQAPTVIHGTPKSKYASRNNTPNNHNNQPSGHVVSSKVIKTVARSPDGKEVLIKEVLEHTYDTGSKKQILLFDKNNPNMSQRKPDMPHRQQSMPHRQSNMPHRQSNMPHRQSNMPHRQSNMPQKRTYMPHRQSNMPQKRTYMPQKRTYMPQKRTYMPQTRPNTDHINQRKTYLPPVRQAHREKPVTKQKPRSYQSGSPRKIHFSHPLANDRRSRYNYNPNNHRRSSSRIDPRQLVDSYDTSVKSTDILSVSNEEADDDDLSTRSEAANDITLNVGSKINISDIKEQPKPNKNTSPLRRLQTQIEKLDSLLQPYRDSSSVKWRNLVDNSDAKSDSRTIDFVKIFKNSALAKYSALYQFLYKHNMYRVETKSGILIGYMPYELFRNGKFFSTTDLVFWPIS